MRILALHVRPSDITDETMAALAAVVVSHPGPDPVEVVIAQRGERWRLPVTVDAEGARRAAGVAVGACAVVLAPALMFDG